jgi:prevent-host-death family protein
MHRNQATVAQEKTKFSEVLDCARSQGPQTVTRNGKLAAVLISAKE